MKNLLIVFLLISYNSFSQFCGTATNKGIITPSITVQTTPSTGNGQRPYWTFTAVAGCTYTFQTCGLTGMDTELEILTSPGLTPLIYNDDACGTQSRLVWLCPTNGNYIIFLTRWNITTCRNLNSNISLQYFNNCINLPIELISFEGLNYNKENVLTWLTASENNNDFFTLEHSVNGTDWQIISIVNGAGNSTEILKYTYNHTEYSIGTNYYRLSQTDYDGKYEIFNIISINNQENKSEIQEVLNALGQKVSLETKGIVFVIYKDGKVKKIYN